MSAATRPAIGKLGSVHHKLTLELTLRPCCEADLKRLEWYGMFTHHRSVLAEVWQQRLAGQQEMLVIDLNGFPIAPTWVDFAKRRAEAVAVLWAVRVFPLFSGQGVGSWMLTEVEHWLRAGGLSGAEVGVEKDNDRARNLYERLGYRYVGELRENYTYTPPRSSIVHAVADQWLLRKVLR